MSRRAALYGRVYRCVCGYHPRLRRWHPQWLSGQMLYEDLREWLAGAEGRILDVGCGDKPYERWAPRAKEFVGIDVYPGEHVDALITPSKPWPLADTSFDFVLCTQVLQHDEHVAHTLAEIQRVLVPGGLVAITAPFIQHELHMHDYWRFSSEGLIKLLDDSYEVVDLRRRGGVGTSVVSLLANWTETSLGASRPVALLAALTLPLRLVGYAAMTSLATLLDRLDGTNAFYANVSVLARKQGTTADR